MVGVDWGQLLRALAQAVCLLLLMLAPSCAKSISPADLTTGGGALAFLNDGQTTREQLLMALGEPTGRFESDRIFTYQFAAPARDRIVVTRNLQLTPGGLPTQMNVEFCLVTVFKGDRVEKHRLISRDNRVAVKATTSTDH